MNLGDPELEMIDPTPNVHALFIQFDRTFFWAKLASRAVVRWSKRMYSCAGVCSYEGRGGLCEIALSEPLLKLRPRKDLVETLLHEMIHAYLFVTSRVQDRDGHGPNFKEHMYRINMAAGINISIYHDFHEEVKLYQTHWWRCNGPCHLRKPHYGIVRRSSNTVPGPKEYWWADHQRTCGGTFVKIKEPEKNTKKTRAAQPKGGITKYITSNKKTTTVPGQPKIVQITDIKSSTATVQTKSNNSGTLVMTQKGINPISKPAIQPSSFVTGKGYTITGTRVRSNSIDVTETVRNIWAKKQLTPSAVSPSAVKEKNNNHIKKPYSPKTAPTNMNNNDLIQKATKHKTDSQHSDSPPGKIKKIDDYFKKNVSSLLKDIYGANIEVAESSNNKLIAVSDTLTSTPPVVKVDCPICGLKIQERNINTHLDECLNKDLIAKMCNENEIAAPHVKIESAAIGDKKNQLNSIVVNKVSKHVSEEILETLITIPPYKPKMPPKQVDTEIKNEEKKAFITFSNETKDWKDYLKTPKIDPVDVYKADSVVRQSEVDNYVRVVDNFAVPKDKNNLGAELLPEVKPVPGTSKEAMITEQKCPCCGNKVTKPIDEHFDECLAFFATDTAPEEASTSVANETILLDDDDDIFDESQVFNATGTKLPCPCCMQMVENNDMNAHLDRCLGIA